MSFRSLFTAALLFAGVAAHAQTPATGVAFGNHLTLASLVSALQNNGYQALVSPAPTPAPGTPVNAAIIGLITSGINGAKVIILVNRCPNSTTDDVCTVNLIAGYGDNKNVINDAALAALNQRSTLAKVLPQKKGDAVTGFSMIYTYVCKDLDDPKFITPVLASFGADIAVVLAAYNTLQPAAAKP